MKINVLYFGRLADFTNCNSQIIENITDTDHLKNYLFQLYPELENAKFQISVNKKIVRTNTIFKMNDEIALLPPFTGG